jgi:hypothetical protein
MMDADNYEVSGARASMVVNRQVYKVLASIIAEKLSAPRNTPKPITSYFRPVHQA